VLVELLEKRAGNRPVESIEQQRMRFSDYIIGGKQVRLVVSKVPQEGPGKLMRGIMVVREGEIGRRVNKTAPQASF
jgi:hypothetical protein